MMLLRIIFLPLSIIYGGILWLRNKLYDWKIINSSTVEIKTIVVGNLSLGGTGKTPHIEYLLRILSDKNVAVLSRGYGRNSSGTQFVKKNSTAFIVGDEPLQIAKKFPNVPVCVESDRLKGIRAIQDQFPQTEVVVLDDAFQHRKLIGGFNILLTTFQNPFFNDFYLPSGTLRDHKIRAKNANLILVTKTPSLDENPDKLNYQKKLTGLSKPIFFDALKYNAPCPFHHNSEISEFEKFILVSGIAKPELFELEVQKSFKVLKHLKFPDHHTFTTKDIQSFKEFIGNFGDLKIAIITTEKDAMRLDQYIDKLTAFQLSVFYVPIEIDMGSDTPKFEKHILGYLNES